MTVSLSGLTRCQCIFKELLGLRLRNHLLTLLSPVCLQGSGGLVVLGMILVFALHGGLKYSLALIDSENIKPATIQSSVSVLWYKFSIKEMIEALLCCQAISLIYLFCLLCFYSFLFYPTIGFHFLFLIYFLLCCGQVPESDFIYSILYTVFFNFIVPPFTS